MEEEEAFTMWNSAQKAVALVVEHPLHAAAGSQVSP